MNNPDFNYEQVSRYDLTVLVRDIHGNIGVSQLLGININDVNESPTITNLPSPPISVPESTILAEIFQVKKKLISL